MGLRHQHAIAATCVHGRCATRRVADVLGDGDGVLRRLDDAVEARDHAHAGRLRDALRLDLVAHGVDRRGRGAHEGDARLDAAPREGRVLGEEAVALCLVFCFLSLLVCLSRGGSVATSTDFNP